MREPAQGSLRPLLASRAPARDATVVLDGSSLLVADVCGWRSCNNQTEGARIALDRPVIDVTGYAVDGRGHLWTLADLDDGTMRLVEIDLAHPTVVFARAVDASVFGDVTRRLVALDGGGAVVMSGNKTELRFTRYEVTP